MSPSFRFIEQNKGTTSHSHLPKWQISLPVVLLLRSDHQETHKHNFMCFRVDKMASSGIRFVSTVWWNGIRISIKVNVQSIFCHQPRKLTRISSNNDLLYSRFILNSEKQLSGSKHLIRACLCVLALLKHCDEEDFKMRTFKLKQNEWKNNYELEVEINLISTH